MHVPVFVVMGLLACQTPPPVAPVEKNTSEAGDDPDEITLVDGQRIVGHALYEDATVVLLGQRSGTFTIERGEVRNIRRRAGSAAPKAVARSERLPAFREMLPVIGRQPWVKDLRQVPATVIENGDLRQIPYISHKAGTIEFNVYGDPDHPVGVEIGIYEANPEPSTREQLRTFMVDVLSNPGDKDLLRGLGLDDDVQRREGLTFDVDPPTLAESYGGWWLTIYDANAIDRARASEDETKDLATAGATADAPPRRARASSSRSSYVRGYSRKNGHYVRSPMGRGSRPRR